MCFCRALWVQRVLMASEDGLMSPESSVTSLLATSGLLQSSLRPERVPSIKYRDRHYISASEALDAYITDFQRSLRDAETTTGKLELPKERTKPHPRNRDGKSAHSIHALSNILGCVHMLWFLSCSSVVLFGQPVNVLYLNLNLEVLFQVLFEVKRNENKKYIFGS